MCSIQNRAPTTRCYTLPIPVLAVGGNPKHRARCLAASPGGFVRGGTHVDRRVDWILSGPVGASSLWGCRENRGRPTCHRREHALDRCAPHLFPATAKVRF